MRKTIPFGGYLSCTFAWQNPTFGPDIMGEVMTPYARVEQAREFHARCGFTSWKVKGGVLEPELDVETMPRLPEALSGHGLRIDPMRASTVPRALKAVDALGGTEAGVLHYLEDPVPAKAAMAELSAQTGMPLATKRAVVEFEQPIEAVKTGAVHFVLSDHRYRRRAHGRDVPGIGHWRVHALQFAHWHFAGRDVPCRRRDAEPDT